jgi:hypothetical protein
MSDRGERLAEKLLVATDFTLWGIVLIGLWLAGAWVFG